jgi:excisionase family DNA binding protein
MDDFLSPEAAAKRLGIKLRTVLDWLRTGKLPAYKFGRQWRIKRADLEAFIEASRVAPETPAVRECKR